MIESSKTIRWTLFILILCVNLSPMHCWPATCPYREQKTRQTTYYVTRWRTVKDSTSCWLIGRCSKYRSESYSETRYQTETYYEYYSGPCEGYCDRPNYKCEDCKRIANCNSDDDVRCSSNSNHYCLNCKTGYALVKRGSVANGKCQSCTTITNCKTDETRCTTLSDQYCRACKTGYTLVDRNGITNGKCQQLCSWLPDSRFCYPGTCDAKGPPSTCSCATGYSGYNCLNINADNAILLTGTVKISGDHDAHVILGSASNEAYTEKDGSVLLNMTWTAKFPATTFLPLKPSYISDFKVGVIYSKVKYFISSQGSVVESRDSLTPTPYMTLSEDNPADTATFSVKESVGTAHYLVDGDRITVTIEATNGGYVRMTGNRKEYYSGKTATVSATFQVDIVDPYHCSDITACSKSNMLTVPSYTDEPRLDFLWSGWEDYSSGVKRYEVEVMSSESRNGTITCLQGEDFTKTCTGMNECTVTVSDTGNYCIQLIVYDFSNKHNSSMRYVFFDNSSSVDVDHTGHYPLWIDSMVSSAGSEWLVNVPDPSGQPKVHVKWPEHFINEIHHRRGLLNPINISEFGIFEDYDMATGQPPNIRSREEIANVNGIVSFKIAFGVDHEGGRTLTPEQSLWFDVQDVMAQESELDIPRNDGDTIRVWVRAFDVMENEAVDNITVHVDSSPPIIEDVHLTKDGVSYLAVHHSVDLFEMRAVFEAYDDHSGLHSIHWTLHDMDDSSQIHGNGTVAVRKPSAIHPECDQPFCTCIPKGDCYHRNYEIELDFSKMNIPDGMHDYDYVFTITATNNAMLQATSEFQVTVDTSPPHEGHVYDSRPSDPDIDFQQDFEIVASWDGFFDRESGIMMYIYYFGETCWEYDGNVTFPNLFPLQNTTSTYAAWTAPWPGKYHCTVMAYNKAMSPSKPVCSDGVVIDTTEPVIREVHIDDVYVRPRLMEDSNSTIWLVDKQRNRHGIENISQMCRDTVSMEVDVDLYPTLVLDVNDTSLAVTDEECMSLSNAPRGGFIRKENHLSLRYIGEDEESGVFDYEVGLSSDSSGLDPDILPFTSTNAHTEYLNYHPNLGEGVEFYVVIKATNRAGSETTKVIGPFFVDVTPPVYNGDILVSFERDNVEEEFLVARWNQDAFFDNDDTEPLTNYAIAVGDTEGGSNVMSFAPIDTLSSDLCQATTPPSCAAIATTLLNWHLHGQHVYYVSVKVENVAGLGVIGTSLPYRHDVLPPAAGVVYEISHPADNVQLGIPEDIDVQAHRSEILCQWFGFSHPYQDIAYSIALGTSSGLDDIVPFQVVGSSLSTYIFSGLTLLNYQKYYVTLIASTEVGNVTVTSDGVVVIEEKLILTDVDVYDGSVCEVSDGERKNATHHDFVPRTECESDISFQASLNTVSAHWRLPDQLKEFITHGQWALQKESDINSSFSVWNQVSDFQPTRVLNSFNATDLSLMPGHHYRSIVKFCHSAGCFKSVSSNGFWVIPMPPVPMGINEIVYDNQTEELTFEWQGFVQQEMSAKHRDFQEPIDYYEWTLSVKNSDGISRHGEIMFPWERLNVMSGPSNTYRTSVRLQSALTFTECLQLGLRGYNKVGLSSTIYRNIINCGAVNSRILPNIVIDAVGDYDGFNVRNVELAENAHWKHSDAEYTRSGEKLSAVWPTLRHGRYEWKLVKHDSIGQNNQAIQQSPLQYNSYDCGESEVLACGETQANFINIENLQLHHGYRYYVCVHAEATRKEYEKTELLLPETSACSDGIVVDQTPPTHGNVWIGSVKQRFQITTSELVLNWDDFYDVEEHGRTKHSSGIRKYDVAIGTSPGGVDVLDFDDVGITNWAVVHDLQLQGGQTYYATVRATDFVGLSSDVVSDGVTVDVTPPMKTDKTIDVGGAYLTFVSAISAKWNGVFEDQESGIEHYEWCIGSRPGFADVFPCIVTMEPEINDANLNDLTLKQGHTYYVTVAAYNGAGLSTTASSWGVVVDSSPPDHGMVYDGQSVEDDKDLDYQTRLDSLTARWKGFHEPHTDIVGYSWKIGTSPGYDDILEEEFVGLVTEMSASDLNLQPGVRYYTTVTACNAAELCTTASSDGIIADNSPPVAGIVYDGISDGDHAFQASRTTISAHWFNFHDPHTQLSHYEWLAGTIPGGDDVMASTRLHLTESAFTSQLQQPLPLNVPIYVTVRAYNKAGLFTESASNGIIVDNSPPETVTAARLDVNEGSITPETQIWRSMLRISWAFSDPDSQIEHHRLSVFTNHQSDMSILPVKTTGVHNHVFTNLTLHDGDTYSVKVIACNGAKLCSMSESPGILVDSSPPSVGTFAVATDHAAGLSRHRQNWMTYLQGQGSETAKVNLAWLGFADIHSGISHYFVTLGTSFAARDLTDNQAVRIQYVHGSSHLDEGVVQTASIPVTRDLHPGEHIYCALWAINGVGLRSYEAHETFVVVKSNNFSGVLSLLRRCDSQTCEGDCTCAPQNQLCHDSTVECNDVTGDGQYEQVDVVDVLDYHDSEADLQDQDVDYTPSACTIAAKWKNTGGDIRIQRYEWTVGSKGGIPGSGLLNPAKDRIWHDGGMGSFAVFSLRSGNLHPDVEYVFYVRAWYDDRTFAVFQSDGVITDFTAPSISTSRKVKDLADLTNLVDIDYSNDLGTLGVSWKNVFPSTSGLSHFMVSISTVPQGEDIRPYNSTEFSVSEYKGMITNLSLQNNHKYYMNVMAVSLAGLHSIASSDGILIDTTEPTSGRVDDGLGVHDADHQNSSTLVSASWYGFSDLQSSIHHYKWCVGSQPGLEDIFPCRDVGLHLSMSVELDVPMISGTHYYSKVSAMDAVGLESQAAVSNGVLVDTTPPQNILKFVAEGNLLRNPSFEEALGQDENTVKRNCTINASSTLCLPKDWQVNGTGYVVMSAGLEAQLEDAYLIVHGTVSQTIETIAGDKYKFSIYISHLRQFTVPLLSQEGFIQIPGIHRVFKLYQRNGNHGNNGLEWFEHIYYFTAESDSTTVTIGSLGRRNGIAVDNARIQHLAVHVDGEVYDENEQPSCISLHSRTNGRTHSVSASWNIMDTESPIVEYLWAIGTVKGGTQVQPFKSVGRSSHAFADDLPLSHGIPMHVTVTARNAADLRSVFYSQPVIVDVTPPNICCIKDGAQIGKDLTHQTSSVISVQWNVSDPESKVEFCEWALGFSPGSGTLKPFTVTGDLAFVEEIFAGVLNHGQTIYATVRCKNFAGLYNQITSNGVTIVQEGPRSEEATVRVVSSSPSMFETRGNHQASTDNINVIWNGFSDLSGISHYECRVLKDGSSNMGSDWRGIGEDGQMAAMLSGINLESYKTYQVQVRAVNHVGLKSDVMSSNVTIETNAPVLTGENIEYTWSASDVVTIRWNNVFKNNSTMIYHLTISTLQGGSDIIKWFETRVTSYDFLAADKSRSYYVSVMAVNEAGLFDTRSDILSYV